MKSKYHVIFIEFNIQRNCAGSEPNANCNAPGVKMVKVTVPNQY